MQDMDTLKLLGMQASPLCRYFLSRSCWLVNGNVRPRSVNTISSAYVDPIRKQLQVTWLEEKLRDHPSHFAAIWLRDSCLCHHCYDPISLMKKHHLANLDPDTFISSVQVNKEMNCLEVDWSCGHRSVFPGKWLLDHDIGSMMSQSNSLRKKPAKLWRADKVIKSFDYQQVIDDNCVFYNWLTTLEEDGLVKLTSAPVEDTTDVIESIGSKVGYLAISHYGEKTFRIEMRPSATNIAYSSGTLSMHIDLPYLQHIPGVIVLHCVKQPKVEGGESRFADGFRAAEDLRNEDAETFSILTNSPIDYHDNGVDLTKFRYYLQNTSIKLDHEGNVCSIIRSDSQRDPLVHTSAEKFQSVYAAVDKFNRILHDPRNLMELKMNEGDVIACDNTRVLHGRKGYKHGQLNNQTRLLIGGYLDWDELLSRRRVIEDELGHN